MRRHGPDSLNSWLVTAGLTFVSMILYAVVRLSSVLFVASMDRFGVDRRRASIPYILTDFIQAISSPLTGFLASKFGARIVMVLGCFVSGVGIASCFFAETIETVTVYWGLVLGVGFGLSVPLLALVITQHFVEKRAIAMGIVYFGGYVGYSGLPPIVELFIEYYGLSGTFLLLAGIMVNCIPVALLLRRPKFSTLKDKICTNVDAIDRNDRYMSSSDEYCYRASSKGVVNCGFEQDNNIENVNVAKQSKVGDNGENAKDCRGVANNELEGSIQNDYLNVTKKSGGQDSIKNVKDCKDAMKNSDVVLFSSSPKLNNERKHNHPNEKLYIPQTNYSSIPRVDEYPQNNLKKNHHLRAFKVFLEPVYIVILIAEAVFEGSLITFITILVDFSLDVGITFSDTKFVLLTFAVFSSIGLVSFGWVTDDGHLSLTTFSGVLFVLRCATSAFIPFSKSMPVLLTAVALHGLCEAPLSNLFPLIIAEYFSPEVHGMAISCRLFLCAPVYLVMPSLIGYFRDGLGSYFHLFLLISVASFISGVLCYFIPQFNCGREDSLLKNKSNI